MAYIYSWYFDERVFPILSEYLHYDFDEFHCLWGDGGEMDDEYIKVKELVDSGEDVYALYYQGDREAPIFMSQIVGFYNKEEYKEYKENAHEPIKDALKKYKPLKINWFEKNFKLVNEAIYKYLDSYGDYDNLSVFDRENYELFLASNNIECEEITKENIINYEEHLKNIFISKEDVKKIGNNLKRKKNVIIQGPPGVGKTYIIKKLIEEVVSIKKSKRLQMIQFHQSYSYEDFIQGFKPNHDGGFKLKNGVFYEFCKRAKSQPSYKHFFVIDEINRGNLSKIFGELLMLLENDKRGPEYAIPLTYSEGEEEFYVPENVYIIGLMNTADRSLAVVDYALRRRFSFITLKPSFGEKFVDYLKEKGVSEDFIHDIISRITALNEVIEADPNLGNGFLIGHSYFCSNIDLEDTTEIDWYNDIIENEIAPTLEEYWYDDLSMAQDEIDKLYYQ